MALLSRSRALCHFPALSRSITSHWHPVVQGKPASASHRIYIERDGQIVSPFHDIPLFANEEKTIMNMIVEIPRWTNAKVEIATSERFNPLKQDIKKGKLRFVRNCFPYKGYIWNYGALPQTWEDPSAVHPHTNAKGDNDPVDVCEIGSQVGYAGQVKQVKILGAMALLDEGETDWKLLAIDTKDPLADTLKDIGDVETYFPGLIDATRRWFKIYKIPDGKPENAFAFEGECKGQEYAHGVVMETHDAWQRLVGGQVVSHGLSVDNATISASPYKASKGLLTQDLATIDTDVDEKPPSNSAVAQIGNGTEKSEQDQKWYFLKTN